MKKLNFLLSVLSLLFVISCSNFSESEESTLSVVLPGTSSRSGVPENLSSYNVAVYSEVGKTLMSMETDKTLSGNDLLAKYASQYRLGVNPGEMILFSNLPEGNYYVAVGAFDADNNMIGMGNAFVTVAQGSNAVANIVIRRTQESGAGGSGSETEVAVRSSGIFYALSFSDLQNAISSDFDDITVYIEETINIEENLNISVPSGKTMKIIRKEGFTSALLNVSAGITLTLNSNSSNGKLWFDGNKENVTATASIIDVSGTLIMNDNVFLQNAKMITDEKGSAVFVDTTGTFTMNKGTICNNYVNWGVVYNTGTFTMNGGSIEYNESSTMACGVFTKGTADLIGGTIQYNKSESRGGGAQAGRDGTLNLKGTSILHNQVVNQDTNMGGGGLYAYAGGILNIYKGEIAYNTEDGTGSYSGGGGVHEYGSTVNFILNDSVYSGRIYIHDNESTNVTGKNNMGCGYTITNADGSTSSGSASDDPVDMTP